jgi:predicted RNA-binding protein YlqC (UPF0109 family)
MSELKEFIEYIIKTLVDHPEEVKVTEVEGKQSTVTVYELRVNKSDMGKVIGKKGQHAYAIRHLVNAVSAKAKKRAFFEILE